MEKQHLSFTQLNMFMRCPRQYKYRYMYGLKIPPAGVMMQSKVWHETLENNYKQKIKTNIDLPLSDMKEFFANRYDKAFSEEEVIFQKDETHASLKDQGIDIVQIHHEQIAPKITPQAVEEEFVVSLGNEFPYTLKGIWDLIEVDGTIVDNKAYKRTPSQSDLDKDLQFTVYSFGYRFTKKMSEKQLRMDAVIKNKTLKTVQFSTTRTDDDCKWLLVLIKDVSDAIKSGNFYPNPVGWHCSPEMCGYWDKCKNHL